MKQIASKLPRWVKKTLRKLWDLRYYGNARFCPVCETSSNRFKTYGMVPRKDAACPRCGVLERHRLLWLFLTKKTDLFNGEQKKMLHIAPEPWVETKFRKVLGQGYLTADLYNPNAMVKMDITDIQYPKESFDIIYCSHVLEHVQEDVKAMVEFYRVLKSDGWAILLVPIVSEKTYEDASIVDQDERLKAFGHPEHVRNYGPDYVDRLREAGFSVDTIRGSDLVNANQAERMGLTPASGEIFYCTK
jgi:SAM-dependent methyltransferase